MTELINQLKTLAEQNQLLTTITSGSVIVWVVSNLRNIFSAVKNCITELISFNIHNLYEDCGNNNSSGTAKKQVFLNNLVSESKAVWERNVDMNFKDSCYYEEHTSIWKTRYISHNWTYGFSVRWFMGSLCAITRSYENNNNKNNVVLNIRVFFTWKKPFVKKLYKKLDEMLEESESEKRKRDDLLVFTGNYTASKYKRSINSVFTNGDEHVGLLEDIRKFIDNKDVYRNMNYPYKYSALLYGKPGTGKTSTIMAVASELKRNIVYVNMSTSTMQDLLRTINENNPKETVYVFEDIDATNASANSNREAGMNGVSDGTTINVESGLKCALVSLSDILNITDGLLSSDGAICLFTTNHIEKLDPAFLRAGRMNRMVEFNYLDGDTANRMIETYLGCRIENIKDEIRPAELQEEILNIKVGRTAKENLVKKFSKV